MATTSVKSDVQFTCEDFGEFQDVMKGLRKIDDRIVYALNTSIPTESFKAEVNATEKCKELYEEMSQIHQRREVAIKTCIAQASKSVAELKQLKEHCEEDLDTLVKLRKQQSKLRLLQNELNIEEVIQERSRKIFYERCRQAYKPPTKPIL